MGHFGEATEVAGGIAELAGEKGLNQIPSNGRAGGAAADADKIHVVVLDTLLGGEVIVDEAGADAVDFIGADASTDTAAADGDAALDIAIGNGVGEGSDEVGVIVIRYEGVSAEIGDLMAGLAELGLNFFLQFESAVVSGNADLHKIVLLSFTKQGCGGIVEGKVGALNRCKVESLHQGYCVMRDA